MQDASQPTRIDVRQSANAVVAQLVVRQLAMLKVASSSLVYRSLQIQEQTT